MGVEVGGDLMVGVVNKAGKEVGGMVERIERAIMAR